MMSDKDYKTIINISDMCEFQGEYVMIESDGQYQPPLNKMFAFVYADNGNGNTYHVAHKCFESNGETSNKIMTQWALDNYIHRVRRLELTEMTDLLGKVFETRKGSDAGNIGYIMLASEIYRRKTKPHLQQ